MTAPDALPVLHVGGIKTDSPHAMCIMNAISYLQGDKVVTDFPSCVDPFLSAVAQYLNDTLCTHTEAAVASPPKLCGACSHTVWLFGLQLMGTAEPWRGGLSPETTEWNQYKLYRKIVIAQIVGDYSVGPHAALPLAREIVRLWESHRSREYDRELELVRGRLHRSYAVLQETLALAQTVPPSAPWADRSFRYLKRLLDFIGERINDTGFGGNVWRDMAELTYSLPSRPAKWHEVDGWAEEQVRRWRREVGFAPAESRLPTAEEIATVGAACPVAVPA